MIRNSEIYNLEQKEKKRYIVMKFSFSILVTKVMQASHHYRIKRRVLGIT